MGSVDSPSRGGSGSGTVDEVEAKGSDGFDVSSGWTSRPWRRGRGRASSASKPLRVSITSPDLSRMVLLDVFQPLRAAGRGNIRVMGGGFGMLMRECAMNLPTLPRPMMWILLL